MHSIRKKNCIFVGIAPASLGEFLSCDTETGRQFMCMLGLIRKQYDQIQKFNLLPEWSSESNDGKFPVVVARMNSDRISYSLSGCIVLVVGFRARIAFRYKQDALRWGCSRNKVLRNVRIAFIPHVELDWKWWSNSRNKKQAEAFLKETGEFLLA